MESPANLSEGIRGIAAEHADYCSVFRQLKTPIQSVLMLLRFNHFTEF